jgi:hypothetical protein
MRVGIAYVGAWGWVEADLVVHWRLRTPDLGIDFNGTINGRIGSAFRLSKLVRLGIGFFTDVSQTDELGGIPNPSAPFAATDVDFYGVHVGFLFSNQETDPARPNPDKDGIGLSIAIGVRYAHGRGDVLGIVIPAEYDPAALQPVPVSAKINEIASNFGAKVAF